MRRHQSQTGEDGRIAAAGQTPTILNRFSIWLLPMASGSSSRVVAPFQG